MLHNWCFKDNNPVFNYFNNLFSVSVFTDENRYDLNPNCLEIEENNNEILIKANGLQWAGGQEDEKGYVEIHVLKIDNALQFFVVAKMEQYIRRVKINFYQQDFGTIVARRRYDVIPNEDGIIMNYPNGWDDLYTPLITIKNNSNINYYRFLDNEVKAKHFVITKVDEKLNVEMVYDEKASLNLNELKTSIFEIGKTNSIEDIFENQRQYIEKAFNLVSWQERKDVPKWAKKMSLIVSLHGMHWSGYMFNTYAQMEEKIDWLAKYCDPKSTCIYIPGFDGRYYFKYPNYDPDERMGGAKGFKKFISHAHELGYHVMPMFMINGANPKTQGFEIWGEPSRYHTRNGYTNGVGSCDWDTGRCYDLGCGVGLNPGAKLWQDYFVKEVIKQATEFDFDAIFLDLAAIYQNDPFNDTHQGAIDIINRIHEKLPQLLIATEGCYDALSIAFPLSQCAGEGSRGLEMIYHDTPYAPIFDTYNRCFGHLCLGAPGNYKNGVFESGYNKAEYRMPIRKGIIPTVTIVDDTIKNDPNGVIEIINDSLRYKDLYLK